jgi:hypothetical protein
MTPLPPELASIRADLHDAARRRARSRRLLPTWLRLPGLTLSAFLALGAVAVAAGLLVPGLDGRGGDPQTVRVVGGPSAGLELRCGPSRGGPPLCRELDRPGSPIDGLPGAARRRDATGIVRTTARLCERERCRELRRPRPDGSPRGPGRFSFIRHAARPAADDAPPRTGGYRATEPGVSWVAVDGAPPHRCVARSTGAACRAWRTVTTAAPPRLGRITTRLGARTVVVETGTRCRRVRHFDCGNLGLSAARRLSADPARLAPGETVSYTRLVFRR